MKQRAKKHLEIALGGNMNIASLKPLALIEIMTDFAKKEVEAINYSQCCTQLKSNETLSFEEWLSHFEKTEDDCCWLNKEVLYCKEEMKLHYEGLPDE
jgi:hypothetical protein